MDLYSEVSSLKGVGPKLKEKLNRCGIYTSLDLLLYFPRDHEFISGNNDYNEINEKERQILTCKVVAFKSGFISKSGKRVTTIEFSYKNLKITGVWFNQPYIKKNFTIGREYNLLGRYKKISTGLEVMNPTITPYEALKSEILPVYALKEDLTNKTMIKLIGEIFKTIEIKENLPKEIISKYKLESLDFSIRNIHFPSNNEDLDKAIVRLKFQELFTYSLKLNMLKYHLKQSSRGIEFKICDELVKLKESLPYRLTNAQSKVIREILIDQKRTSPMNRLVQGDVGCGKTILALIAMFNVYKNGYQVALMAPTEILANQHYIEAKKLFKDFYIEIELLTGSTTNKEKLRIKERMKNSKPIMVIGTHALIQEDVEFSNLGFIVTDEQHRFGVEQRSKFINKGKEIDCLVMSATPIPRTIALYLYSDLEISVVDELPPGRKAIETRFFEEKSRDLAYGKVREEISKGRQCYVVCPLIDENEEMKLNSVEKVFNELSEGIFRDVKVNMLHGKMSPKEKDEIIQGFKSDETKIIVSTTVIEVGVNVPNASVMIIENSERFGLAQLHQLRGRVGRGEYQSYCFLIGKGSNPVTKRRMEIMVESNDGFYVSEQDLKIRGTGEMFGVRQSGEDGLVLANIVEDVNILKSANMEAKKAVESKEDEYINLCNEILKNLKRSSKYICFN